MPNSNNIIKAFGKPSSVAHNSSYKIFSNLPKRLALFVGRDEVMKEIDVLLSSNSAVSIGAFAGTGKSSTAIEYGHKMKEEGALVRFIMSGTTDKINTSYRELAQELGIDLSLRIDNKQRLDMYEVIRLVHRKSAKNADKVLFIFDNVENYCDIEKVISNLSTTSIKAIITSRDKKLLPKADCNINLAPFGKEEAAYYVTETFGKKIRKDVALQLAQFLASKDNFILPHKLSKAVALLQSKKLWTVEDYISHIKTRPDEDEYMLLFEQVAKNPLVWCILQYGSFLDPDFIDIGVLNALKLCSENDLGKAIEELEKLSLASIEYKGTVLGIKLHRLVQKKIFNCFTLKKDIMSDKEKLLSHLLSHLSELMPYVKESPGETWKQAEKIYPHIKCVLQSSDIYLKTKDTADLLNKIAEYQRLVVNDFNSSLNCNKKALKIYKELNNTVPNADIAHCLNDLGNVCYSNSQFDDALDYYNQSLTIKKKIYKEDHPSVAISLNNLGAVYAQKGQYNTASRFYNQALEIRSAIYQEDHPSIAISLNNLASICVENAQYDDALVYYNQALAIKRQIYKEDHPSIADCLNSLGNVCWNKRQYDDALKYYEQALEINKKMYEENNANIANCLNNLANIYARKDKYEDALKCYKQALEIRKKIYEKNHPSIANILNNSGNICIYKGWYDAALLFHNQALGIRKKVYKMDHLDIANSLNNLKILFNNLGYKYKADSYLKIKNFVSSSNNFLETPIINLFFDEDDIKMTSRITVKLARTLNRIAGEAKESNWCSGFFIDKTKNMLGDWGVQCFTADFYIREKLQDLYSVDSMEVSKLLCFEAICLGIASQTSLIKNYKCLDEFMEINPGIADVVLKKHPEYFVNTNLLQYYKYYICNQELLQKTLKLVQNMFEHSEIKNEELEHDKNLNTSLTDADSTNLPTVNFAGRTDSDTIDTVGEI